MILPYQIEELDTNDTHIFFQGPRFKWQNIKMLQTLLVSIDAFLLSIAE